MKLEWKTCFKIGFSIFALYLCIHFFPGALSILTALIGAATPLVVGCIIAYIINILMSFYEKHYFPKSKKKLVCKSRRPVCMFAAFLSLLAVIALILILIVPQLSSCVQVIIAEIPDALDRFVVWIEKLDILPEDIIGTLSTIDWQSKISQIVSAVSTGIGSVMNVVITTVTSVFSGIVSALIGIIFSIYLLSGKEKLRLQFTRLMKHYMKESWYEKSMYVLRVFHDCFRRYIIGQCTEAIILGLLCILGMLILRLPYAGMIGALIAFTALIPIAGAYIGAIIGAFMILTVSPMKALIFLIFLVVLQQFEGNVIYPRVVGSSMGLPGIWVLAAVTIGGGMFGIGGMLIGVPITAAAYRLIKEDLSKK